MVTSEIKPPRLRRLSPKETQWCSQAVTKWLRLGVIIPTNQTLLMNPVFVDDGPNKIRTCIDYRPINEATEEFKWRLPLIQDLRDAAMKGKVFSHIDLRAAYHNLSLTKTASDLTAFATPFGNYQFRKLPFGLKGAPAEYQRAMEILLDGLDVLIYLDDILIASEWNTHNSLVSKVLKRLASVSWEINYDESEFFQKEILFCGMVLTHGSCRVSYEPNWEIPTNRSTAQSLIGMANYVRPWTEGLSHWIKIISPTKEKFVMTEERINASHQLIKAVQSNQQKLTSFDANKPCTLFTDASSWAIGAVLYQDGILAIKSKALTKTQTRYSATDREHLALYTAVIDFRLFLHSNKNLILATDHTALLNRRDDKLNHRQFRWKSAILATNSRITYVKGTENPADWPSRLRGWGQKGKA